MATVTSIAEAIVDVFDGLAWIDAASANEYLPSAVGSSVCAFVVPYNQETRTLPDVLDPNVMTLVHTLVIEFWIQSTPGQPATMMQRARDAGTLAYTALIAQDGSGYILSREFGFTEKIDPLPTKHMGIEWLVSEVRVSVENEVTT